MLRVVVLALLGIALLLGASIGYYNAQAVRFDYLLGQADLPLIGLLLLVFAGAVLLTFLVLAGRLLGLRNEIRRLRKQLRAAETELRSLRNLPLGTDAAPAPAALPKPPV